MCFARRLCAWPHVQVIMTKSLGIVKKCYNHKDIIALNILSWSDHFYDVVKKYEKR